MKNSKLAKISLFLLALFVSGLFLMTPTSSAEAGGCVPWCTEDTPGYNGVIGVGKEITWDGTSYYILNDSNEVVYVAINYFVPGDPTSSCLASMSASCARYDHWVTEGWWRINPGQTRKLISNYTNRYIYIHAKGAEGGLWSGSLYKYVTNSVFTNANTSTYGAYLAGFIKVDLGKNNSSFTTRLLD